MQLSANELSNRYNKAKGVGRANLHQISRTIFLKESKMCMILFLNFHCPFNKSIILFILYDYFVLYYFYSLLLFFINFIS